MNRISLTKSTIDRLPIPSPGETGKAGFVRYYDDRLHGFGLKVSHATAKSPNGRKTFVIGYRTRDRRERLMVLGVYGRMTVDQARSRALEVLAEVNRGGDPVRDARTGGMVETMQELFEAYLKDHIEAGENRQTIDAARRALGHAKSTLGRLTVAEVKRSDVIKARDRLRETPGLQNTFINYVRAAWNWGQDRGRVPEEKLNPALRIKANASTPRKRRLTPEEYARLGQAIRDMLADNKNDPARLLAILFIAFTGCRPVEALRLRPSDVKTERGLIVLADHKTAQKTGEPKTFLITRQIGWILSKAAALRELRGHEDFLFPRRRDQLEHNWYNRAWSAICKKAKLDGVVLYNLRSGYINEARHGLKLDDSETADLTKHSDLKVLRKHYATDDSPAVRTNAATLDDHLAAAMGFGPKESIRIEM